MDIHRSRFVSYPIPAINALAFSCSNSFETKQAGGLQSLRLAVGRSNGNIEIWNPYSQVWVQERIFHGGYNRSIEGLAWIQNPSETKSNITINGNLRLLSIGLSNAVTEWNLDTGLPAKHWVGSQSDIWSITTQPRDFSNPGSEQSVVVGCADGSLVLLSTADNELVFKNSIARPTSKKAKVLSIEFQKRDILVAGFSDGTLKIYDIRKGMLIRTISLGAGPKGGAKDILVWSVKCLPSGNIITGDSTGEIRFFDGKLYSETQRLASHDADILDIAVDEKKNTIFSAGMDRKTSTYRPGSGTLKWIKQSHTTYHEHDVKAMATYQGNRLNVIASGGIDTNLVIIPMKKQNRENQLTLSGLPQSPTFTNCIKHHIFASWWDREISVWKITKKSSKTKSHHLMAKIAVSGEENISNASLSYNGSILAVCTASEFKLFGLSSEKSASHRLRIQKQFSSKISIRQSTFSPDDKWLAYVMNSNEVMIIDTETLLQSKGFEGAIEVTRIERVTSELGTLGNYQRCVTKLVFSPDSKMLVTCDLSGYIDSWCFNPTKKASLTNGGVNGKHHSIDDSSSDNEATKISNDPLWILNPTADVVPKLRTSANILVFRNGYDSQTRLIALTSLHQLFEFDMSTGLLTDWSRANQTEKLPGDFLNLKDRAIGSFWGSPGWLWLYGVSWLFGINVDVNHDSEKARQTLVPQFGDRDQLKPMVGKVHSGAGDKKDKIFEEGLIPTEAASDTDEMDIDEADEEDAMDIDLEQKNNGPDIAGINDKKPKKNKKDWFLTFKYRPIAGIIPVRQTDGKHVEVVLIERPIWDLDLPPRFEKVHS